jgi:predicted negative regulator of RcsB-dependent stress response
VSQIMPQLIALALIGAGAVAGYRWFNRQMEAARAAAERAESELRRAAETAAGAPKDLGRLELDMASGVYKPRAPGA